MTATEHWKQQAHCRNTDPEPFFPPKMHGKNPPIPYLCKHCPVKTDCLNYAIETRSEGIWGGENVSKATIKRLKKRVTCDSQ